VGGIPELVRDPELGRLVPPEDPESLAKALVEMLTLDAGAIAALSRSARDEVESRDRSLGFEAGIDRLARWIA
jgi:glycosyltransferase involved in cell wall biosynthesis